VTEHTFRAGPTRDLWVGACITLGSQPGLWEVTQVTEDGFHVRPFVAQPPPPKVSHPAPWYRQFEKRRRP
jgi:hypothetical protein